MRSFHVIGLATLFLGLTLSACQTVSHLPTTLQATAPAALDRRVTPASRGYGQLAMSIRWSQRQVQYIPASATQIAFKVFVGSDPHAYAAQTATSPGVGGTSTVRFEALPAGEVTIVASAKDNANQVVAAGSTQLTIIPNALVRGGLTLLSTTSPQIVSLIPQAADPGSEVHLFGTHFGADPGRNATYSVWVGGLLAGGATLIDDGTLKFTVPENATNSVVTLQVDALATESTQVFTTIRQWSLTPATADIFVPFGTEDFHALARDYTGATVPNPPVTSWSVVTLNGTPGASTVLEADTHPEDLDAEFRAPDGLGTYQVQVGRGSAAQSATITTHALSFADVADQLGVLPGETAPADNPTTAEKVALGKRLFFDTGIGSNGQMSCASCHLPSKGWGDGLKVGIGNDGLPLDRNSPTLLNTGLAGRGSMFWDGRAANLEEQARKVFENPRELNRPGDALLTYLNSAGYPASFSAVFGAAPSTGIEAMDRVTKAIASFERTVVTQPSAFDRWAQGDAAALGVQEKRGLGVFTTRGRCIQCHNGPMFTDEQFHNISIMEAGGMLNAGRQAVTGLSTDMGRFKTPTLRNIEETAPYFHNGSVSNLTDAILHYEGDFGETPNIDPLVAEPIQISSQDRADLIAFLRALAGATPSIQP